MTELKFDSEIHCDIVEDCLRWDEKGFELFVEIEEWDGYYISILGNVGSSKQGKWRVLKPGITNGYYAVNLCKDEKERIVMIHRLVGETFLKNPENKPLIDHRDKERLNNHLSNLSFVTNSENNWNRSDTKGREGMINIYDEKDCNSWRIKIDKNRKTAFDQNFHKSKYTLEQVQKIRDEKRKEIFGKFDRS